MAELEALKQLLYGVDWTEPWLVALLGFHASTAIAILLLRGYPYIQACILSVLGVLCLASERINEYAAMNYEKFASHQYFDSSGFFIFVVYAGPIIFNCFLIVLCWLYEVWKLLVKAGSMKAKRKQRQQTRTPLTNKKKEE